MPLWIAGPIVVVLSVLVLALGWAVMELRQAFRYQQEVIASYKRSVECFESMVEAYRRAEAIYKELLETYRQLVEVQEAQVRVKNMLLDMYKNPLDEPETEEACPSLQ